MPLFALLAHSEWWCVCSDYLYLRKQSQTSTKRLLLLHSRCVQCSNTCLRTQQFCLGVTLHTPGQYCCVSLCCHRRNSSLKVWSMPHEASQCCPPWFWLVFLDRRFMQDPEILSLPLSVSFLFLIDSHSGWTPQLHVCTSSGSFGVGSVEPFVYSCAAEVAQQEPVSLFWGVWLRPLLSASFRRIIWFHNEGEERKEW